MDKRIRRTFLLLIVVQAAHSLEEYVFRLYDVFGPARFVSSILTGNLPLGFALANVGLLLFGLWCYVARVLLGHRSAKGWIWFWVLLEFANGIGHLVLALNGGRYFPGLFTAPLLLTLSIYLGVTMLRTRNHRAVAA